MASIRTKLAVGLFVLAGFVLITAGVFWLGLSHYLESGTYYAAYFNESVQGLDKDSPVKYRGVTIGRVNRISVAPDGKLIEVIMKVESGLRPDEDLSQLVAKLKSVGLTGIMYIELDRQSKSNKPSHLKLSFTPEYPVIPTEPSEYQRFIQGVGDLLNQFRAADFEGMVEGFKQVADSLNQAVQRADVGSLSTEMQTALNRMNRILEAPQWKVVLNQLADAGKNVNQLTGQAGKTMEQLNMLLKGNRQHLDRTITALQQAVEAANGLMAGGSQLVQGTEDRLSQLQNNLVALIENLRRISENLNRFTERISEQPSQLLFGAPPPEKHFDTNKTHPRGIK